MPLVSYAGAAYPSAPGESVLDALLRHGVPIANSCRAAACQSCMLRASSGAVPAAAQRGLKATLIEQGYFLSCSWVPDTDVVVESAGGLEVGAAIASLERLTPSVLRARVKIDAPLPYRAGQYITLLRGDGLSRSYSLASLPDEDTLELHVRLAPHGRMSGWLFDGAREGEPIKVRGPAGDCFYTTGKPEQPLLLVATGTGLAPLIGISRDALRSGHTGEMHLYHGSRDQSGLYLQDELSALARRHANFHYTAVVPSSEGERTAAVLSSTIAERHPSLAGWRGFVCGNPPAVSALKMKMFLLGMPSKEIFADAFLEAPRPR